MLHKKYKKLTCGKNLLHSLHGDFSGFYSFVFNLNSSKLLLFLMQSRTIFQILGPKKVSVPLYIVLTLITFFFNNHNNAEHFPRRFRSWKVATTHSLSYLSEGVQWIKMHNLDRLFLMPFHKVYLLDYLISYYGTSIPMGSNQTRRQ